MARAKPKNPDAPFAPPQWPASKVTMWKVKDLKPYPHNARAHPADQVNKLAADMLAFGVTTPILIDEDGVILYGHGRRLAAIKNGYEEYPVNIAMGWDEDRKRAARIADNKRGDESHWDNDTLTKELLALKANDFDLTSIGFSAAELAALIERTPGHTSPDETPPLPDKPFIQTGDVWALGRHRLIVGDSTDEATVNRLFGKDAPTLCVTDPPYGVDYNADWRNKAARTSPGMKRSARSIGKVQNDNRADWREAFALFKGDVIYVWHAGKYAAVVAQSLTACDFEIFYQLIWAKPVHVIGRGDYHWQHEPCWYAVRKGKTHRWNGSRKETTLWQIENMHRTQGNVDDGKTNHSTQKPVECMKRPMENNSKPGEFVYDPFVGSGTSIIAAEASGRNCLACELDPAYAQMAIERWQRFTKEAATLNGAPFDQVKRERGGGNANAKGSGGVAVPGRGRGGSKKKS